MTDKNYLLLKEIFDRLSKDFDFEKAPDEVRGYARAAQDFLFDALDFYEAYWRAGNDR